MGRRTPSFYSAVRGIARAARQTEVANRRYQREMERQSCREQRTLEQEYKKQLKEEKQVYLEDREQEVDDLNTDLRDKIESLQSILACTLDIDDKISFRSLHPKKPQRDIPEEYAKTILAPCAEDFTWKVGKPSWLTKLFPGWEDRYTKALNRAQLEYESAISFHKKQEEQKQSKLTLLNHEYETALKVYEQRLAEIKEFEEAYKSADPSAISSYNAMVLERSEYPDCFPQVFQVAYIPESKEIVIDYEFPDGEIIPTIGEYKYVKSKDEIQTKPRKVKEIKDLYEDVLLGLTLRIIHEIFEADQSSHIETVTFSGYINSIDAATGKDIKPYLISVRTTKEKFSEIDLARIDKRVCLRNLGAQVSSSPKDIVSVKPIVHFNMYDKRFVGHEDILTGLDNRPNLYELNPFEFENLICNLFEKMGFESKLTRSSKDGGVDVIAFDPRPILGGKVVIQAKRYKNTVGVSDVRDLWGTMDHERAHKGILITTSGFSPDSYNFSDGKPVELIDGGGLLHLLGEVGIDAHIQFPSEPAAH